MPSPSFLGADPAQLRDLGRRLHEASGRLRAIVGSTGRAVTDTQWYGRDSDQFRQEWSARWGPAMAAVAEALDGAAVDLQRNAEQQDSASGAGGGTADGGGAGAASGPGSDAGSGTGTGPAAAVETWQRWYGRLSAAIGLAPSIGSAITWTDAPLVGPNTWAAAAGQWEKIHLPSATLGGALKAFDVAGVAVDSYQAGGAAYNGDYLEALQHGIPAALAIGSASPNPWVSLPSAAGSAGWEVGSWINDTFEVEIADGIDATVAGIEKFNSSPAGIWIGDNLVGPTGDALVGSWETLAAAIGGNEQQSGTP